MRLTWSQPEDLLLHELVQSRSEGRDVGDVERRWVDATGGSLQAPVSGAAATPASPEDRLLAVELLGQLDALPRLVDESHPETLADLEAAWATEGTSPFDKLRERSDRVGERDDSARRGDDSTRGRSGSTSERDDSTRGRDESRDPASASVPIERFHGAWLGRAVGCLLGKPVEKIPREGIEAIARDTDNWPVAGYFTAMGLDPSTAEQWPWNRRSAPTSLAENISGMPEDDDLNYPLLNLALLERRGQGFDTEDVALAWLADLPAGRVFTAERAAYRNLLQAVDLEQVARVRNPFREWIGALIRGDVFGWVNPGDPVAAARLAWRDARLSHTRNGIYGELWAAALASASLVAGNVDDLLADAARVVPRHSELAQAIAFGTELGRRDLDLPQRLDALHEAYGHLHWVHTLNNAATIACALNSSRGDFQAGITFAVMAGWDTDSAGATVGSVLGGLLGRDGIPAGWTDPLDNRIDTSLPGGEVRIDELAERTRQLSLALAASSPAASEVSDANR